jgi:hypothetical protein
MRKILTALALLFTATTASAHSNDYAQEARFSVWISNEHQRYYDPYGTRRYAGNIWLDRRGYYRCFLPGGNPYGYLYDQYWRPVTRWNFYRPGAMSYRLRCMR